MGRAVGRLVWLKAARLQSVKAGLRGRVVLRIILSSELILVRERFQRCHEMNGFALGAMIELGALQSEEDF